MKTIIPTVFGCLGDFFPIVTIELKSQNLIIDRSPKMMLQCSQEIEESLRRNFWLTPHSSARISSSKNLGSKIA